MRLPFCAFLFSSESAKTLDGFELWPVLYRAVLFRRICFICSIICCVWAPARLATRFSDVLCSALLAGLRTPAPLGLFDCVLGLLAAACCCFGAISNLCVCTTLAGCYCGPWEALGLLLEVSLRGCLVVAVAGACLLGLACVCLISLLSSCSSGSSWTIDVSCTSETPFSSSCGGSAWYVISYISLPWVPGRSGA